MLRWDSDRDDVGLLEAARLHFQTDFSCVFDILGSLPIHAGFWAPAWYLFSDADVGITRLERTQKKTEICSPLTQSYRFKRMRWVKGVKQQLTLYRCISNETCVWYVRRWRESEKTPNFPPMTRRHPYQLFQGSLNAVRWSNWRYKGYLTEILRHKHYTTAGLVSKMS